MKVDRKWFIDIPFQYNTWHVQCVAPQRYVGALCKTSVNVE